MTDPVSPGEKGSLVFFASWLLLHEKADDWIRDALRRARETPEDLRDAYQQFLVGVEREKEHLKAFVGQALVNEIRDLGFLDRDQAEDLRCEMEDLRARLRGLEEQLERRSGDGDP